MRKLKTKDIPAACRTMKAIGVADEVKKIAKESDRVADAFDRGFDLLYTIFDRATEQEGESHLYQFLAGPFECTPAEVAEMELPELFNNLKQLADENDLAGFFTTVRDMMQGK